MIFANKKMACYTTNVKATLKKKLLLPLPKTLLTLLRVMYFFRISPDINLLFKNVNKHRNFF